MKCISRLKKYEDDDFDKIILLIRNGTIKTGRYAHLAKIDLKRKLEGKTFFTEDNNDSRE